MENKYSEDIMEAVRQNLGLDDENDTSKDKQINAMSPNEVFRRCLEWEGIIGYDGFMLNLIYGVYGIDLTDEIYQKQTLLKRT